MAADTTDPNRSAHEPARSSDDPADTTTVYELVGGADAFVELVDRFYEGVEVDELLRPLYPEDLAPGKHALAMFFVQYWGGPRLYEAERGHPMLRRRHAPFEVTHDGALRWAHHMAAAIRSMEFASAAEFALLDYVVRFTPSMINTFEDPPTI
ncbi:MAG: hemoglobin [Nitriliruptoraceae bacterium]|jgi:hemoglobin